jgi:hypothetical protein
MSVDRFANEAGVAGGGRPAHIAELRVGDVFPDETLATWTGAYLSNRGVWANASDRDRKENFAPVNGRDILARVAALPVTQWNYRNEPGVKRIGPVAQDFRAAFGVGRDDKTIATGDETGVALAAIQGLHQLVQEKDAQIAALAARVGQLEGLVADIAALPEQLARGVAQSAVVTER